MSFAFTLDPYQMLNFVNAFLTIVVLVGCSIWLARFATSAIKHRDKIGAFLVTLAILLIAGNLIALIVQLGQGFGLSDYRVTFSLVRLAERIGSIILVFLLFYLGKDRYNG